MRTGLVTALIFVGVFLALTALASLLGSLGSWELLAIAAVAALVAFLVATWGGRRAERRAKRPPEVGSSRAEGAGSLD